MCKLQFYICLYIYIYIYIYIYSIYLYIFFHGFLNAIIFFHIFPYISFFEGMFENLNKLKTVRSNGFFSITGFPVSESYPTCISLNITSPESRILLTFH